MTILSNVSSTVDRVRVNATGRYAYISTSNYQNVSSTSQGQVKRLKSYTIMYSNANLTGTKYHYLANTSVQILDNVSSTIDRVKVIQTGRYAYVRNNSYR